MMLWDIIRDFFVKFVFGGMDSNGYYFGGRIGELYSLLEPDNNFDISNEIANTTNIGFPLGNLYEGANGVVLHGTYITMGDWLSTTATIITLVALFIGIMWLTIKLFKYVSSLFLLR